MALKMLSFIIIGRNEGWKLSKCLESVFKTIKQNNLFAYEVIYVDSDSTDNSILLAKRFNNIKVILLTGIVNAAIARNIGAIESSGDVLFFIDGDMEIMPDFLSTVIDNDCNLKYNFVSGQLKNFNYDENDNFINNSWLYKEVLLHDKYYTTTGGIFLIQKSLWDSVGGMDVRFKRGQDLDIALRLANKGTLIIRKKEIIANHHTIAYTHKSRIWRTIFSGDISYSNSFLYRKHILNSKVYIKILKTNYTLLALLLSIMLSIVFNSFYFILVYSTIVGYKSIKNRKLSNIFGIDLMLFYIVRDIAIIFFFLQPLPKIDKLKIHYKIV